MKFRILIHSRHASVISDFFRQTANYFDCLSTSECLDDIANHFKLFRPEAYICFCEGAVCGPIITQMRALRSSHAFSSVPIIVIGDETACNMLERLPQKPDLIIRTPVSPEKMISDIVNLIRNRQTSSAPSQQTIPLKPAPKPIPVTPVRPVQPVQQTPPGVKTEETNQTEPAKEPEKPAVSQTKSQAVIDEVPKNNKNTILVIDDDRSILRLIKSAAGETFNVTTMLNGDLLDKFFENRTVDLILLDYEMPGENGPDVFKRLRAMPNVQDTPIVFLTGVSDRKKIQEVLSLKPQGYVLKPINMDKLFSTIYGLLR